jgi:methylenetetrahydrofolate reductase (NADPH)
MSSPATASLHSARDAAVGEEKLAIAALAQAASVEMTWHDSVHLDACRAFLTSGTLMYVSHIAGQTWRETLSTCVAVRGAGLEPVPHLPVRELTDEAVLEGLLSDLVARADVKRVLLIAGDRAAPLGPFSQALDVLQCGLLARYGIREVTVAGHPEGHPRIPASELERAEREKLARAADAGIALEFLTQFFFEPEPFLRWVRELRATGVRARIVAGLAGPAKLSTLFKYALRCGVGPSIRALGMRPGSFAGLVGERGPESVVRAIARAMAEEEIGPAGMHLYSFGGLERSCAWIGAVARGSFVLDDSGAFIVEPALRR